MPETLLPIFPLPNVVFFPKIFLPLHIFEPRYRLMVEDALEGDKNIGMCLLQEGWQADYFGSPPVHSIGCIGKIETFERLPQGRFNILLRGLRRFEILKFVQDRPYRIAAVKLLEDRPFLLENHEQMRAREALLERFMTYFQQVLGMEVNEERLDRSASLEAVVNQVAAVLDIPVQQKQALLETVAMEKRLAKVQGILDNALNYAEKLRQVVRLMRYEPSDPELN